MITILNRPYDSINPKVNPVYDGLGFVVDSNLKLNTSFKYIAEVYVSGQKVAELKHSPDISNNNIGIFDLGRIIENYTTGNPDLTILQTAGSANANSSVIPYYVRFGEEFSRIMSIQTLINSGGFVRITTLQPHNLATNDRILIQNTSQTIYNTYANITYVNDTTFTTDIPYTAVAQVGVAYFLCGERITLWSSYTGSDGSTYFQFRVKVGSSFNEGDLIFVRQDRKDISGNTVAVANSNIENIEWLITQRTNFATYTQLRTNIPFVNPVSTTIYGSIVSRSNFKNLNSFSTQNDLSYTYNGVAQWNDFLTYSVSNYCFSSTQSAGSFLNLNPNKEVDICKEDYYTLQYFGTNIINQVAPLTTTWRRIRIETWSTPISTSLYPITSVSVDNSVLSNRLAVSVATNLTTLFTAGSYVSLSNSISLDTQVIKSTHASGITTIVLNTAYSAYSLPIDIVVNTQLRRYDLLFSQIAGLVPAGPANLNNTQGEIANGSCFKYLIYPIRYVLNNQYNFEVYGDVWTFNLDCSCKEGKWIMFMNSNGAYDYFYFDGREDKARNIEKQIWSRKLKSYVSGSGLKFRNGDRGITTYNTKSRESGTLRSRFLTQAEIDWLWYILESPEVYIVEGSKKIPITVDGGTYDIPDKRFVGENGRLFYMTLNYTAARDRVIQRGAI